LLKKKIFTPGPTQVNPEVYKSTIQTAPYHRSLNFSELHNSLIEKLKVIFQTKNNLTVLTCSGTGAMETAVVNFCRKNDYVLFINQGRFGARWGNIIKSYGLNADSLDIVYGYSADISHFEKLNIDKYSAVFLTHSETSTATLTDIKSIAKYIKNNSNAIVIADAITSIGSIEFKMDEWGIDVAISASQKGLMTPPGLAVIAYNTTAYERLLASNLPKFYFDLQKEIKSFSEKKYTSWTPAVGLFLGLNKACEILLDEGLENRWNKTNQIAEYFRNFMQQNEFRLFSYNPSDSLTAVILPNNIPSSLLIKSLYDKYEIQIANGQADLKDKIARISHMGDIDLEDIKILCNLIIEQIKLINC
jgi:aspartate aminotransferase-like enzyme